MKVTNIDEFATISSIASSKINKKEADTAKEILNLVNGILQTGGGVNIHVFVALQRPDADAIPGALCANIDAVVSFHVTSAVQSAVILGAGHNEAYDLPAIPGRALISRAGEYQQVQTVIME